MTDLPIEQFLCRTPKRRRPNHITMPSLLTTSCPTKTSQVEEKTESHDPTVLPSLPRPPVPPRRHTLAEICRYADEHCAYIEWMTRELEAEEAARCHSMPTTPAGAITNPFSGPADMWWRPTSANEMYGKSALRRQQEEEEKARMQHPYLAANGLPELLEANQPKEDNEKIDLEFEPTNKEVKLVSSNSQTLDNDKVCEARSEAFLTEPDYDLRACFENQDDYEAWLRRGRVLASRRPSQRWQTLDSSLDSSCMEQDSIILMIPKAVLCFLLLPLILTVSWCSFSFSEDEANFEDEDF